MHYGFFCFVVVSLTAKKNVTETFNDIFFLDKKAEDIHPAILKLQVSTRSAFFFFYQSANKFHQQNPI